MICRRRLVSMSRVAGSVLDRYHGAEARRCAVSVVGWPWRVYQRMSRLWQNSPKGTGALHGFLHPVAGLSDAEDVLGRRRR
jgi:hypothetical protein